MSTKQVNVSNTDSTPVDPKTGFVGIDPANIQVLNDWMWWSGSALVISSTWRLSYSLPSLNQILRDKGYNGPDAIGVTPEFHDKIVDGSIIRNRRGTEILSWAAASNAKNFIIFDDMPPSEFPGLTNRFVRTSPRPSHGGLQHRHLTRAIRLLQRLTQKDIQ